MLPRNVAEERLRFTTDLAEAVRTSEVLFIAVGTPQDEDGSADLSHVLDGGRGHRPRDERLQGHREQVDGARSAPPRRVREVIGGLTKHPFAVVSNPEFLKEGTAVDDFLKPDRVVIGTDDPKVEAVMRKLYEPFVRTGNPILVMDPASAELTQVRGQRHAGHAHLVHERDREPTATGWAPTSRRCGWGWAPTPASARRSCSRAWATAAPASRRT